MKSVYQTKEWEEINKLAGKSILFLDYKKKAHILAAEAELTLPLIGNKRILTSEGTPFYEKEEDLLEILRLFKKEAKKYYYATISPTITDKQEEVFKLAGYKKVGNFTILIDLAPSLESIRDKIEKRVKRYFEPRGFSIKTASALEEYEKCYYLNKSTLEAGGIESFSIGFFRNFDILRKRGLADLFLAVKNNEIIAFVLILYFDDYSLYLTSGSTEEGYNLNAVKSLFWQIIRHSKSIGKKFLDLGGYDKNAKEGDKTYSINKFKEGFGGQIVEQPIYSTNWKYPFFRWLLKKFRFMRKWYKK